MNNRRKLIVALGAGAIVAPLAAYAQPQGKVWRIGFLGSENAIGYAARGPVDRVMRKTGHVHAGLRRRVGADTPCRSTRRNLPIAYSLI